MQARPRSPAATSRIDSPYLSTYAWRISASLCPAAMRRLMSARIALRRRRLAVGHREALALRALELGLELVRPRRGATARRSATARPRARRPRRHASAIHGPTAGSSRCPRRGEERLELGRRSSGRTSPPTTTPLGEMANVSGCPRVREVERGLRRRDRARSSSPMPLSFDVRLRSPSCSRASRTMPTITKSGSSACSA